MRRFPLVSLIWFILSVVGTFVLFGNGVTAAPNPDALNEALSVVPLQIKTANTVVLLDAEVARSPKERQIGLMYRKELPQNRGMIFLFEKVQPVVMWMKNTYIGLDMLFFDEHFVIVDIHENAKPLDETLIRSKMPVYGVVEVNAGFVRAHHIHVGDRIDHQLLFLKEEGAVR